MLFQDRDAIATSRLRHGEGDVCTRGARACLETKDGGERRRANAIGRRSTENLGSGIRGGVDRGLATHDKLNKQVDPSLHKMACRNLSQLLKERMHLRILVDVCSPVDHHADSKAAQHAVAEHLKNHVFLLAV